MGRPETPVELQVKEGEGPRTIRFLPRGEPRPVQRASVRDGTGGADCPWL